MRRTAAITGLVALLGASKAQAQKAGDVLTDHYPYASLQTADQWDKRKAHQLVFRDSLGGPAYFMRFFYGDSTIKTEVRYRTCPIADSYEAAVSNYPFGLADAAKKIVILDWNEDGIIDSVFNITPGMTRTSNEDRPPCPGEAPHHRWTEPLPQGPLPRVPRGVEVPYEPTRRT